MKKKIKWTNGRLGHKCLDSGAISKPVKKLASMKREKNTTKIRIALVIACNDLAHP